MAATWWEIATAIGTVLTVIVAVGLSAWQARREKRREEDRLASQIVVNHSRPSHRPKGDMERNMRGEVAISAKDLLAPLHDRMWCVDLYVHNYSPAVIRSVRAGIEWSNAEPLEAPLDDHRTIHDVDGRVSYTRMQHVEPNHTADHRAVTRYWAAPPADGSGAVIADAWVEWTDLHGNTWRCTHLGRPERTGKPVRGAIRRQVPGFAVGATAATAVAAAVVRYT